MSPNWTPPSHAPTHVESTPAIPRAIPPMPMPPGAFGPGEYATALDNAAADELPGLVNDLISNDMLIQVFAHIRTADAARAIMDGAQLDPNVGVDTASGETPLICLTSAPEVAHVLISLGADVNSTTESGRTPLHDAVWRRNPAMVQLLVDAGADVHAVWPATGETPMQVAEANGYAELIRIMRA